MSNNETLRSEFKRVFGSVSGDNDGRGLMADGWPEAVQYNTEKALSVLAKFADDAGSTESGDAKVCRALKQAGALA